MNDAPVDLAAVAAWLADQTPPPSPVIPALCQRFGLTPKQAVDAIRLKNGAAFR